MKMKKGDKVYIHSIFIIVGHTKVMTMSRPLRKFGLMAKGHRGGLQMG